jgi:protein-arginine kinase activator protein McsA
MSHKITRTEFARLAANQVADQYDDKIDHLHSAIEALLAYENNGRGPWSASWNPQVRTKINQQRQRLQKLIEKRHTAVEVAYNLAWAQWPAYQLYQLQQAAV